MNIQNIIDKTILNKDVSIYEYASKNDKFDKTILDPSYWKVNSGGFLTNQVLVLSLSEDKKITTDIITLENVSINISLTPTIITHSLKGKDTTVKQFFSNNDYDIVVTGSFIGPYDFQQDIKGIKKLINILNSKQSIYCTNAELNLNYNVKQIVCTGYSFTQNAEFYQIKDFTISFKSDSDETFVELSGISVDFESFPSLDTK